MSPESVREILAAADAVLHSGGPGWESDAESIIIRLADALRDARAAIVSELRWLAKAREEYQTPVFPGIEREVHTAYLLADILERRHPVADGGQGFGWLPSWRWDEWDQMGSSS